jgi:hypothetical protein
MTCKRCGTFTPRLTLNQRYCPPCQRDVDAKLAPKPEPAFVPMWRRQGTAKDMTGALGR